MSAPAEAPRASGARLRAEWPLDPDMASLDHGGYGVTPRRGLAGQAYNELGDDERLAALF